MLGRLKKGIYPWRPPTGYLCEQNKKHAMKKETPDPIDPVNFPIIQKALRELSKKPFTQTDFANALNRYGLVSAKGKAIDLKNADRILTLHLNFYAGKLKNPFYPEAGEAWYKDGHTPMITEEELLAIRKMRQHKKVKEWPATEKIARLNELFPLKGTLFCFLCRHKLTGSTSRGNGGIYHYYHCFTVGCPRKGRALESKGIEASFLAYIAHITPTKEFLEMFRAKVIDEWNEQGRKFDLHIKSYETGISDLQERKAKVRAVKSQGECTDGQYKDRMAEIGNKELVTNISLNEAKIEKFDIETAVIYATTFIANLSRTWFDLPRELKLQFQKLVFPEGVFVDANKILRTTKLGLIYNLERKVLPQTNDNRDFVDPTGFEPVTSTLQMWRSTK